MPNKLLKVCVNLLDFEIMLSIPFLISSQKIYSAFYGINGTIFGYVMSCRVRCEKYPH